MGGRLKNSIVGKTISGKFGNELKFIKSWVSNPKTTGSIVPTGVQLARSMASLIRPDSGLPVLELGPGTGPITKMILERGVAPQDLYALEYSPDFLKTLRESFPEVNFIIGDAFDLERALAGIDVEKFDCVISSLPLLNFDQEARIQLIDDLLDRVPEGRPVVQFSYGAKSPVRANGGSYTSEHYDWVMRNVPPARVWLYRRPCGS